jgi:methylglyoxal synthase
MARIGLVAHDQKKDEMVAWAKLNAARLKPHELWGTGTTGARIIEGAGLNVSRLKSGPLGGDAQLGAMIAEGRLDALIFFQDPLTAMPHDVDIKSMQRLATLYNILFSPIEATGDALLVAIDASGTAT